MSSSVDLIPRLREQSSSVNLSTLQKRDGDITRLLMTAKHVGLYHLNTETSAFTRQEVEGPLFLVERRTRPQYELVILNRKSMTDWSHNVAATMADAMEVQDKYLYFQSNEPGLVITLWFHEQPDCANALDVLKRVCAHLARQTPNGPLQPFEPTTTQTPAPTKVHNNNPHSHANNNSAKPHSQPQHTPSPPATSASPPAATPSPASDKSFTSPYAPPPTIEYNVALPSTGAKNDRELSARLNGFLSTLASADSQQSQAYQAELREAERRKKDNARRFQEEERRKQEHEARTQREERQKRAASSSPPTVTTDPAAATAAVAAPFPTMLSPDQLVMLQSFSASATTNTNLAPTHFHAPAPASPAAPAASELERNLAATKARKAARATAAQPQTTTTYPQAPAASSLPASLLFAAAQSTSHPPMPVASTSPIIRPQLHSSAAHTPLASASVSPVMRPAAANQSADIHPLLAMLNQSVANRSPSPTHIAPQTSPVVPYTSPYAVSTARTDATTTAASNAAPAPTLLSPAHFLAAAAAAPSTTTGVPSAANSSSSQLMTPQSLLSTLQLGGPATTAAAPSNTATPSGVMSRVDYRAHLMSLLNDPATFDWMYQKYLARPNQHPFA